MPTAYWPTEDALLLFRESALKRGVHREDILHMLAVRSHDLDLLGFGHVDKRDFIYGGRSTLARGWTAGGDLLEVGLRLDHRAERELCIVFPARYL